MDFDDNNGFDNQQEDAVEIYSRNAVLGFSILFDPLIGSILLIINLWVVGYKKAIIQVVVFTILFETVLTTFEYWYAGKYQLDSPGTPTAIIFVVVCKLLQVAGGIGLLQLFYKKYFPEKDYYPRNVILPLLISFFVILLMARYGMGF
jgi:hypothetical protein